MGVTVWKVPIYLGADRILLVSGKMETKGSSFGKIMPRKGNVVVKAPEDWTDVQTVLELGIRFCSNKIP